MDSLSSEQYCRLLGSIEILNSGIESESLATRLIASVANLVENDIAGFEAFTESGGYLGIVALDPVEPISDSLTELCTEFYLEHPLVEEVFVKDRLPESPIVDFRVDPRFERSNLYNGYYRPMGIEQQLSMAFTVEKDVLATCTLNRNKTRFTTGDQLILKSFRPHVAAAIRNSWIFDKVKEREENLLNILDRSDVGAITFGPDGCVELLSSRAISILGRFFCNEKISANGLPLSLWNWASVGLNSFTSNGKGSQVPHSSMRVENETETLSAEFATDLGTGNSTILLKAKPRMNALGLEAMGLTKTEAGILYLISMGKTNAEIALLRSISPRTVQKHIENICDKLGAENRTAAAMRAAEAFR